MNHLAKVALVVSRVHGYVYSLLAQTSRILDQFLQDPLCSSPSSSFFLAFFVPLPPKCFGARVNIRVITHSRAHTHQEKQQTREKRAAYLWSPLRCYSFPNPLFSLSSSLFSCFDYAHRYRGSSLSLLLGLLAWSLVSTETSLPRASGTLVTRPLIQSLRAHKHMHRQPFPTQHIHAILPTVKTSYIRVHE